MTAEPLDLEARMSSFARTFPSMRDVPGVPLWDANTLDRWAAETPVSGGELVTARFLLAVWDPGHPWRCGRFDLMEAIRAWDERQPRPLLLDEPGAALGREGEDVRVELSL